MDSRVCINGRFLTQKVTGVQRFAIEITAALAKLRDDIYIAIPPTYGREPVRGVLRGIPAEIVGRGDGHLWEQVYLPRYLDKTGHPLLLNLGNTAPIGYDRKISTLHDISYIKCPKSYSPAFRVLYRVEIPIVLKRSLEIFTVSDFSRHEIENYYGLNPARIEIVSNAVSQIFHERTTAPSRRRPYFLAVGSLAPHKNFGTLIEAFSILKSRCNDSRLVVVGGNANSFADASLEGESIQGLTMAGRVNDQGLAELYQGACAFVFPSTYEGFGIPPLEAQASGCPVIASRAASIPEVLGDSALYFDPESAADIASTMEQVWIDSRLRGELSRRGMLNAKRFSWESSAKKVSKILDSIV